MSKGSKSRAIQKQLLILSNLKFEVVLETKLLKQEISANSWKLFIWSLEIYLSMVSLANWQKCPKILSSSCNLVIIKLNIPRLFEFDVYSLICLNFQYII